MLIQCRETELFGTAVSDGRIASVRDDRSWSFGGIIAVKVTTEIQGQKPAQVPFRPP